jgi:starch-binding outer membrane protein, SusD/RagB family
MKKILYIIILALSLIAYGCSDFLEEDNKGGISNDVFYKTAVGYETLITASYASLRTVYGSCDINGNYNGSCPWLLLAGTDLYQKTRQNDHLSLYEYSSLYPSDQYVLEYYSNCYKAIQTINMALYYNDYPTDLAEATRTQYKAEMRFLRAFYHFLLVEQFGGISINQEPTLEGPRMNMPRNTLADCYDFIISEMEDCLPDLTASTVARVNQRVANHYLAKVYLTRAWDLGNTADFTAAKSYAQAVITAASGGITLSYHNLWSPTNENNSEILFAVQYSAASIATTSQGNTQQALFGQYMGGSETHQKLMLTQLIPAWNLHKWYAANDARYNESFMLTVYENYFDYYDHDTTTLKVRAYYPRIWGRDFTQADRVAWKATHDTISSFVCYPFLENNEEAYRAGFNRDFYTPVLKKFDSPASRDFGSTSTTASVRDVVLARVAEDYFIYAEACIGLNDYVSAANYVQDVLDRPGNAKSGSLTNSIASATTQQEALEQYLIESGKEFIGEYNGRWPELRRTGMLQFMVEKYNYDIIKQGIDLDFDTYKLRPIPEDAIIINEGIDEDDQNPGY